MEVKQKNAPDIQIESNADNEKSFIRVVVIEKPFILEMIKL